MHTAEPYGYIYAADTYCATDLIERLVREGRVNTAHPHADRESVEILLNGLARQEGIDRDRESSFDSDDFPKVLLGCDVTTQYEESQDPESVFATRCCDCGELIEDELPIRWREAAEQREALRG